jgi:acyl dehydratase
MDPAYMLAQPVRTIHQRYTRRDTMLYALGVGAGQADDPAELPYVFEQDLRALPSMAVVLASPGFWQDDPRFEIDWKRLLHAEQSCEFLAPLPVEGEVKGVSYIDAIEDKGAGRGALLRVVREIYDAADDRLLSRVKQTSFLRGDGGCGSAGATITPLSAVPDRPADISVRLNTRIEQALIYRLSGDYNPLHADPEIAQAAGFARPILHGLCTYGFATRAILAQVCGEDPARLRQIDCRFTSPVYPGDELEVLIWQESNENVAFRVNVPGRNVTVLDRGAAILRVS